MKYPKFDHKEIEENILTFWQNEKIVQKLRDKNSDRKKFYFLDGPPYTSGKFHLGHAWNYALKDIVLRYKRAHGLNVWDRNGFDVHGLPTEHKVMAKYNLETKEDIEKFGVDKFVQECQDFCLEMADVMTKDLVRMGVTFDVSNPYMALKTKFMEGEWNLIKKAYQQKKLYYSEKVLTWCQHCETAVAKHECEYKNVNDKSIFVKFPIKGKENEFLIIWTTTPWTLPYNLAVMVGPNIDYVKVEVEGEKWILAKALAGVVVGSVVGKKMQVVEEMKGSELEGLGYVHPFDKYLPRYAELKKDHPNVHTIILSEQYVDTTAGTGLVHCAPGSGPEDHEACKPYNIPPFNELQEDGFFSETMGKFAGLRAKVDDDKFIEALKDEGVLVAATYVEHEYPHCWRCKHPVVFRITYQWFFNVEQVKQDILAGNKDVHWVPDTALNAYESWVANLKDNSITRQRFWGTPVPIWKCAKCEEVKVIGSKKEIEENGGVAPENIHKPWIDKVKLDCSCGEKMIRVPDIIDVWVDAGTASWNCLDNDPEKMEMWYPADMILEAREQTRLWFSMLSICSHLYLGNNSFENVYVYGMLNDIEGKKMSKSIGNIISPYELIDKHGVDVLRYYMCQNNAGQDINFSWEECKVKERQLNILWNVHKLLINLAKEVKVNPAKLDTGVIYTHMSLEERYIISKLHSTIANVTTLMDQYLIDQSITPLEDLYLELSRTYIQMVRDKSSLGSESERQVVVYTIYKVLFDCLKMFNVFAPFTCEAIYQNLKQEFELSEQSISHFTWPELDGRKINPDLEAQFEVVKSIIQAGLNSRERARLGLRWPAKELLVASKDEAVKKAVDVLSEILKNQLNVKNVEVVENLLGVKETIKPDYKKLGPAFGKLSAKIIAKLAQDSSESVLMHFENDGGYTFEIEGETVTVLPEHVLVERDVPEGFAGSDFKGGSVYLDLERNSELEAEGYAREIMRKIQSLRKDAGLEKQNRIIMHLKAPEDLSSSLAVYISDIQEKIGCDKLEISKVDPTESFEKKEEFKVKGQSFVASFNIV